MLNEIDLSRIDLNLLVLFEVVLEQRHVGRAAGQLNLSPSAVSHGLGRLRKLFNDPLFLRTPKGVVPTVRANELAGAIADILARVRGVVSSSESFEAANSTRRFVIGSPDGVPAVLLPRLLAKLHRAAPGIDIGMRELLPPGAPKSRQYVWEAALADLDGRAMDIAVLPVDAVPARFVARTLYEEDFVVAMRAAHPFRRNLTLDRFCEMQHLVVSLTGDAFGFVDESLAAQGLTRRIALTVPNFMTALAVVAETDLMVTLPGQLAARHAQRFGVTSVAPPLVLPRFQIRAVVPKVAMMDAGVSWLLDCLQEAAATRDSLRQRRHPRRSGHGVGRPQDRA